MPAAGLLNRRTAGCILLLLACGGWLWWKCRHDSTIPFLPVKSSAQWIVYPKPPDTIPRHAAALPATFTRSFSLTAMPATARLSVRAFKEGTVRINGRLVPGLTLSEQNWKTVHAIDTAGLLQAGTNQISVTVTNNFGPPALWLTLWIGSSPVCSDQTWDVSFAGAAWQKAVLASAPPPIRPGNPLFGRERVRDSLGRTWPTLLLIVALATACLAGFQWLQRRGRVPTPTVLLFVVLGAWVVIFCNNLPKLGPLLGFDRDGHTQYIDHILQTGALPLADEGWQMYQPPFYYALCAGLLGALDLSASSDDGLMVLRVTSALIGLIHLVLLFLCLRLVFPGQPGCQMVGLLIGAFLPANLYLSHHPTNEGLAALFVTASLYFTLGILGSENKTLRLYAGAGTCLGLALLTKFSAVLAVPFVFGAMAWRWFQDSPAEAAKNRERRRAVLNGIGLAVAITLAICGWHYWRVWQRFGNPLIGNWDPKLSLAWWQDPGYRTAPWYAHFGGSLVAPLFSSISSFADGLYSSLWGDGLGSGSARIGFRPQWDYHLMNDGYVLAVLITLLLLLGALLVLYRFLRKPNAGWFLMCGLLGAFAFGLIFMTLRVASYAQVKAFYALPALLPLCALVGVSFGTLSERKPALRPVLWIVLLTWAITSYAAFWIDSGTPFTATVTGLGLADDRRYADAIQKYSRALQLDPKYLEARIGLIDSLERSGQHAEASQQVARALQQNPHDPEVLIRSAVNAVVEHRNQDGLQPLKEAIALAPDHPTAYQQLAILLGWLRRPREVLEACEQGLRVNPFSAELHRLLAAAATSCGDMTNAVFHLHCLVALEPRKVETLNNLAWILAASPNPALRNGPEAIRLAQRACELSENREPVLLGTLAAAYAEAERFDEAIAAAEKAKTLATENGQKEVAERNDQLLQLFRAKKPYHDSD
jgi:tetratricopeptide (TPR) repeat protein